MAISKINAKTLKNQEGVINEVKTVLGHRPEGVVSGAHERITQLRSELQAAQLEAGVVELDEFPEEDSTHHVTSGVVYNAIKVARKETNDNFQDLQLDNTSIQGFTITGLRLVDNTITSGGGDNQTVTFYCKPFSKGDRISFIANIKNSESVYHRIMISTVSPNEYIRENGSIVGYQATVLSSKSYSNDVTIPYDNCYVFYYFNSSYYNSRTYKIYRINRLVDKFNQLTERVKDTSSYTIYGPTFGAKSSMTINMQTLKVNEGSNSNYVVYYSKTPLNQGDIIRFTGRASAAKTTIFCCTTTEPEAYITSNGTIIGLSLDYLGGQGSSNQDFELEVPYDNAYIVFYRHSADWYSGSIQLSYYFANQSKTWREGIESHLENIDTESLELADDLIPPIPFMKQMPQSWASESGLSYSRDNDIAHIIHSGDSSAVIFYMPTPFKKGDYIRLAGSSSSNRSVGWGFTTTNPSSLGSLEGLELNNADSLSSGKKTKALVKVPYDNAYFLYYRYNTDWYGFTARWYSYNDVISYNNDTKINSIESDATSYFQWLSGYSGSSYASYTTTTTNQETGVVTVSINNGTTTYSHGTGIKATSLPGGKYRLEFDTTQEFLGATVYTSTTTGNSGTTIPQEDIVFNGDSIVNTHIYKDGHYTLWLNIKQETLTFYIHFRNSAQEPHSSGTTITVRNFKVTRVVDDINWYTRTIMGGYMGKSTSIDAREEIDGEPNPNFGEIFTVSESSLMASNFIPLMDCDKFEITIPETSSAEGIYGIAGAVIYDSNKQPIKAINIVEEGTYKTTTKEITRTSDMAYVRHHSGSGSGFITNGVKLYYSFETLRKKYANETFITSVSRSVSTYNKGVKWSTGAIDSTYWRHGSVIVEGAEYINIRGRIIDSSGTYINYGGIVVDKEGNILDVIYKMSTTTASSYTHNIVYKLPTNAYRVLWCIHSDTTSTTIYLYSSLRNWKDYMVEKMSSVDSIIDDKQISDKTNVRNTLELIGQAAYNYTSNAQPVISSRLGLLHFSDWHESTNAGTKLLNWANYIKNFYYELAGSTGSFVNDIICTGDVVENYLSSAGAKPLPYLAVDGLAQNSLYVLGNHDQAYSSNGTRRYGYFWADAGENGDGNIDTTVAKSEAIKSTHEFSYNTYFKDFHSGWEVIMPTEWTPENLDLTGDDYPYYGSDDVSNPYHHACYWHKDYEAQKVRLIGIDCMYRFDGILDKDGNGDFIRDENTKLLKIASGGGGYAKLTTEQETWLYDLLEDIRLKNISIEAEITSDSSISSGDKAAYKKARTWSVVVICHYPLDDCDGFNVLTDKCNTNANGGIVLNYKTGDPVNFHYGYSDTALTLENTFDLRNRVQNNSTYGFTKGNTNNFGDIIQNFQNKGGKFVAWICGHTHVDRFYYPKKYPNILNIVIDKAGYTRTNSVSRRNSNEESSLCANYYAIDTTSGWIKIVRLGLNTNRMLRSIRSLCYDYINKKVISEI